jgi:hypothetical protein
VKFRTTIDISSEIASAVVSGAVVLGFLALLSGLDRADIGYVIGFVVGQLVFLWSAYRQRDRDPAWRP